MKKFVVATALLLAAAMPAFADDAQPESATPTVASATQAAASVGQLLVSADGARIGRIFRVNDDGSVSVIYEGGVVTLPAATLSLNGERVVTSLSRREVNRLN